MKVYLLKTISGLIPSDAESDEWFHKQKTGSVISAEVKQVRNYEFHKKLFALFNLSFGYWEPGEIDSKYKNPEKSFERFRKDLIILAGYYKTEIRLDGSVRVEAESISFASMDANTFEKLYQNVLTVIMKRIPVLDKMTKEEIDDLVNKFLAFA